MKQVPVSVFVIAKDEEDRIETAIQSVIDWVDEVVVVDSESSDNTVECARNLGARTIVEPWRGYGPQKIFAESLCRNDWLLNIDADEEVSEEARDEILSLFSDQGPGADGYRVPVLPLLPGMKTAHRKTIHQRPVRLYRRAVLGFRDSGVFDSVVLREDAPDEIIISDLKGVLLHRTFRSLAHQLEKMNGYTTLQAEEMVRRGKVPSRVKMAVTPISSFSKSYFLRWQFMNGWNGFSQSILYSFKRYVRLAKARELAEQERLKS